MTPGSEKPEPDYQFERALAQRGRLAIAGVDEAGRGPLAGPVAAAAVILDPAAIPDGLNDSKKLSARARDRLFDDVLANARAVGIAFASLDEIAILNIREASLCAMRRAVLALAIPADFALIDGNATPRHMPCSAETSVRGDTLCLSIAAASIVAKVTRDRLMDRIDREAPLYGFIRNAGYGTAGHLAALNACGPTEFHRIGFAPVRAAQSKAR